MAAIAGRVVVELRLRALKRRPRPVPERGEEALLLLGRAHAEERRATEAEPGDGDRHAAVPIGHLLGQDDAATGPAARAARRALLDAERLSEPHPPREREEGMVGRHGLAPRVRFDAERAELLAAEAADLLVLGFEVSADGEVDHGHRSPLPAKPSSRSGTSAAAASSASSRPPAICASVRMSRIDFSTGWSFMKPWPPRICTAFGPTNSACSAASASALAPSHPALPPTSSAAAARHTARRAMSTAVARSAIRKASA